MVRWNQNLGTFPAPPSIRTTGWIHGKVDQGISMNLIR
jgi:hypothetical protein